MAEVAAAVAAPSGIAALIGLTVQVIGSSYTYIHGVHDAPFHVRQFVSELENLRPVLLRVMKLAEETNLVEMFGDAGSCLLQIKQSDEYIVILEEVRDKLQQQQKGSSFRKVMKALTWPFSKEETRSLIESLHRHLEIYTGATAVDSITVGMLILNEERQSQEGEYAYSRIKTILDWLSPLNMNQKQQDTLSRRHSNTGSWLLENTVFQTWINSKDSHQTLWCPGGPGTGKTVITSAVIDRLKNQYMRDDRQVAYVYCDYKDQAAQTTENLVACLARQLIENRKMLPQQLEELYKVREQQKIRPSLDELKRLLIALCDPHKRTYIVVDALDECEEVKERRRFLTLLGSLPHRSTKLFVTSRPNNQDILRVFAQAPQIEIAASPSDIHSFVAEKLEEREELREIVTPQLKDEIVSKICARASGMFLLAVLQIDRIVDAMTVREIKTALSSMPEKLDDLYGEIIERIKRQSGNRGKLGTRLLSWITNARRSLSVEELRHGLAVKYDNDEKQSTELDKDNLVSSRNLVDVCAGLVIIDPQSQIIRLVHYTTQQYFDKKRLHLFEDAEVDMSRVCLTYLSYDFGIEVGYLQSRFSMFSEAYEAIRTAIEAVKSHPFLNYASHHWFSHVKGVLLMENPDAESLKLVKRFKTSKILAQSIALLGSLSASSGNWGRLTYHSEKKIFSLEVASDLGLEELVIVLLDHSTGSCPDLDSSLCFASYRGHLNVVKLLLQHGARVSSVVNGALFLLGETTTALGAACAAGHLSVVKTLIENGADIHGEVLATLPPFHAATAHDRPVLINFLLKEGVDVNARDSIGRTACHLAAQYSGVNSLKCLLDAHCDLELTDHRGCTALHYAAASEDIKMIDLLLDGGADASAKSKYGETAQKILERQLSTYKSPDHKVYPITIKILQQLVQRLLQLEQKSSAPVANGP